MMKNVFLDAASNLDFSFIKKWKEKGGKVVGYTCSFMPVELFYAADILPVRLRGINVNSMEISDSYYGPFVCSFPKAIIQLAGSGKFNFLDGAVISNGCDTLRRMNDCWRKMGKDIKGSLPSWFYYFDVPHKPDIHALDWYANQVKKLIFAIEKHFNVEITEEKLKEAIKNQNKVRRLLWELEKLRRENPYRIKGTEAYSAIIAGTVIPLDIYEKLLLELIDDINQRKTDCSQNTKKLFLAGSVCDDFDLVSLIEKSNAVVVGENICFGVRNEQDIVSETDAPIRALTAKYLSGSVCPRMMGYYKERAAMIINRFKKSKADGLIMQNIRFCDLHGTENGLLERDLEKNNIPSLRIEREYGPLTETGRLKMRVDAFIEQLKKGEI
ncbi:2-hydroxyglutaryl-CoA dehydratase, D-component [Candidatus Magnetomorum sp. HK-1]|nr:2-hydroxyglutaryl-CoA dehydratase, D-component [Candidatus Magnetomorum sp. HK-1]